MVESTVVDAGDRDLLGRLRAGDAGALEALMAQYGARVYRVAYGITRNEADAEEIVQDVFLTVFTKSEMFEGRSALGSWMYRVTMNAALNKRRGKRFTVETSLETLLPEFLDNGHRAGDPAYLAADWSSLPDEVLMTGEARAALTRGLEALPEHYRAVLVLRDVEGLSTEEVADVVGESVPSVKSRLHRARMAMREHVTRHLGPRS
jgi:RNA polymerase sigma-70 factor (ECF subfamily)